MILRTEYPCCRRRATLRAAEHVARERYDRRCPSCGLVWIVDRLTIDATPGRRVDRLEWFLSSYRERVAEAGR